jgi:DNA invertase Pin-like site-specific DNA recombinase
MGIMYGYARVSREDQDLALQLDALHAAGVPAANVVQDKASGAKERPALDKLVASLGEGDSLVTWKIDRLGRTLSGLVLLVDELRAKGVRLVILTLGLDTATPAGRMILGVMASLAEFERAQLIERTIAGIAAAKRRGVHTGRPHALTAHQRTEAARMASEGKSCRMQPIAQSPRRLHRTLGDGIAVRWRHFAIWFGAPTAMDSPARLGADQAAGFRITAFLIAQSGWQLLAMPADRLPRAPRVAERVSLSLPRARHGAAPAERIPSGPGHDGDGGEADW